MKQYLSATRAQSKWSVIIAVVASLALVGFVYRDTVVTLVTKEWLKLDESMGHGFLVFFACVYIACRKKFYFDYEQSEPDYRAFIAIVFLGMVWSLVKLVDINIIQQLLLPVIFLLSVHLLLGKNISKRLLIPVAFIYFAIPVWDYLNDYLVTIAAAVVQKAVALSDITAFIHGNSVFLASGEIVIAAGCSGLRYLIVALFLSSFCGYMYFNSFLIRILIIIAGLVLSLIANWVRIYAIIIVADLTDMQSDLIEDHETLGWFVFMFFMLPIFIVNYRFGNDPELEQRLPAGKAAETAGWKSLLSFILLICSLNVGPVTTSVLVNRSITSQISLNIQSSNSDTWHISEKSDREMAWNPKYPEPADFIYTVYEKAEYQIEELKYVYVKSEDGEDILPYIENIYDPGVWTSTGREKYIGQPGEEYMKVYLSNKYNQAKIILAFQYNVGGKLTSDGKLAKLYQIPALLENKAYSVFKVVSIECDAGCDTADKLLETFLLKSSYTISTL